MHILLLTSSYKSEFNTVSALFFRDQALALKNNQMQVGVICPLPISLRQYGKANPLILMMNCIMTMVFIHMSVLFYRYLSGLKEVKKLGLV